MKKQKQNRRTKEGLSFLKMGHKNKSKSHESGEKKLVGMGRGLTGMGGNYKKTGKVIRMYVPYTCMRLSQKKVSGVMFICFMCDASTSCVLTLLPAQLSCSNMHCIASLRNTA